MASRFRRRTDRAPAAQRTAGWNRGAWHRRRDRVAIQALSGRPRARTDADEASAGPPARAGPARGPTVARARGLGRRRPGASAYDPGPPPALGGRLVEVGGDHPA